LFGTLENLNLEFVSGLGIGIWNLLRAELAACSPGYVGTKRFLRQVVPSGFKCPSPTATTDPPVFADPAFTFVVFEVTKMFQYL